MKKILAFGLLLFCLDQILGLALNHVYLRTRTGEGVGLTNYSVSKDTDVLILGSSRAKHHADPAVLEPKLSLRVYNAGINGHDFLYSAMLLDVWRQRHAPPRAIVLFVDIPSFERNEEELTKASVFTFYAPESGVVREILDQRGPFERAKRFSSLYRFNGKILPMLKNFNKSPAESFNGFAGLQGTIDQTNLPSTSPAMKSGDLRRPFWNLKLRYFSEMVAYSRQHNVKLFLVHSPAFRENSNAHEEWAEHLRNLLRQYPEVQFIDLCEATAPEIFAGRADYYKDTSHLNEMGAIVFSELLAERMAQCLPGASIGGDGRNVLPKNQTKDNAIPLPPVEGPLGKGNG